MTNILEAASFGATSTTDEVLSDVNLKGQRIPVTGASAGIGMETARSLAAHGSQAIGAARDLNKAKLSPSRCETTTRPMVEASNWLNPNLASLKSVRARAARSHDGDARCSEPRVPD